MFALCCCLTLNAAFAKLEINVSRIDSENCSAKIENYKSVSVNSTNIKVTFGTRAQVSIFNNCPFVEIAKTKRQVLIHGGKAVSDTECINGKLCTISILKNLDDNIIFFLQSHHLAKMVRMDNSQKSNEPIKFKTKSKGKILVAIDAGHGGVDPGTVGRYSLEKDITLKYAKFIAKDLKSAGFDVYLTRESDQYIKLHKRIDAAMERNVDVFISIHADAARNLKARGATVYTLAPQAVHNATLKAEVRTNIGENFIRNAKDKDLIFNILNVQHNSNVKQAFGIAKLLIAKMENHNIRLTSRPIRNEPFAVLKAPIFPAILVEIGYLSNREDERLLSNYKHMEAISRSIKETLKTMQNQAK